MREIDGVKMPERRQRRAQGRVEGETSAGPVPKLGPATNPGNAHWCEGHRRMECTKSKNGQRDERCHGHAVRGTDSCTKHSGVTRAKALVQGEAQITAWRLVQSGNAPTIDPSMAVLGVLHMSWLRLAAYSEMLRQQVEQRMNVEGTEIIEAGDPYQGAGRGGAVMRGSTGGLIGFRYGAAGKDGILYEQGEEIRALVQLEGLERDRVVKYAKTAHDMGISERLTGIAERWGDVVAGRISDLLGELQLTPEQERMVPALIERHLSSIDMTDAA